LSSIEDRGQTDRVTALPRAHALDIDLLPWPTALPFNPRRAMVISHAHTKNQVKKGSRFKR